MRAVDTWCAARTPTPELFGQIADPGATGYRPRHFAWKPFVSPREFDARLADCEFLVAHAGMGSIINALCAAKPIVVLPRRADLREHRNDHQLATAEQFADHPGVFVAADEAALPALLDRLVEGAGHSAAPASPFAEARLLDVLEDFIRGDA